MNKSWHYLVLSEMICVILSLSIGTLFNSRALADDVYPTRTITIVVPYPPGGATDTLARFIGEKLQTSWGKPVVVLNKPGASGIIGANFVNQQPADGYTILVANTSLIQQPAMMEKLPFDALTDFVPVVQTTSTSNLFVVPSNSPAKSLKDFVALAKADPGKYNFGSWGVGSSAQIHGVLLNQQAGINLEHVPFQGSAPMITNLMGGHIDSAFVDIPSIMPYISSVRPLAVTGPSRIPSLPNIPTFTELGYQSFEPRGWHGMFVRTGTSQAIIRKLSEELNRILNLSETIKQIDVLGMLKAGGSPEEFTARMKTDAQIYTGIIKAAGIKISQ